MGGSGARGLLSGFIARFGDLLGVFFGRVGGPEALGDLLELDNSSERLLFSFRELVLALIVFVCVLSNVGLFDDLLDLVLILSLEVLLVEPIKVRSINLMKDILLKIDLLPLLPSLLEHLNRLQSKFSLLLRELPILPQRINTHYKLLLARLEWRILKDLPLLLLSRLISPLLLRCILLFPLFILPIFLFLLLSLDLLIDFGVVDNGGLISLLE